MDDEWVGRLMAADMWIDTVEAAKAEVFLDFCGEIAVADLSGTIPDSETQSFRTAKDPEAVKAVLEAKQKYGTLSYREMLGFPPVTPPSDS